MRKGRFTETQIIGMIKVTGSTYTSTDWLWPRCAASTASIGRQANAQQSPTGSPASFYKLKAKYGGMEVSDARRLKSLEEENAKLKRVLAETMLDVVVLKDLLGKR